jgi:hypothetical protein
MSIELAVDINQKLRADGFVFVPGAEFRLDVEARGAFEALSREWQNLPLDEYLKGREPFRRRRYGCYACLPDSSQISALPHQPFYQSRRHNRFVGGINRRLQKLTPMVRDNQFLIELIKLNLAHLQAEAKNKQLSKVGVHQIRILSNSQFIGAPTPEGIHRDGVSYFSVHLIKRFNILEGGVTSIFSPAGTQISSLTLIDRLDSLYADDRSIFHCVSEITPGDITDHAYRDVLITTYE